MSIDPHAEASDENPEEHIGDEVPDPWTDQADTGWPDDDRDLAAEVAGQDAGEAS